MKSFKEFRGENIDEAPLVARDMDIVDSLWKEIRDKIYYSKQRGNKT